MSPTASETRPAPPGSPVRWCPSVGRRLRLDSVESLGISTQTLAERELAAANWTLAADLAEYFLDEMTRINNALYAWLGVILDADGPSSVPDRPAERMVAAMRGFGPGDGDLAAVLQACAAHDADAAIRRLELMRVRVAAVHDHLVWWIQHLLADIAERHDDDAVREVMLITYDLVWEARYAAWPDLTPLERLQLSAETMRGHLSGPQRRGSFGIVDEPDRYTMVLDPCGACGVLRNGDPDSGRDGCQPAGTRHPHAWAWNRTGVGWYAVHSPIVMEWLQMSQGRPPRRPLEGCDTNDPCRWFIYKDPAPARPEHYAGVGFQPPGATDTSDHRL